MNLIKNNIYNYNIIVYSDYMIKLKRTYIAIAFLVLMISAVATASFWPPGNDNDNDIYYKDEPSLGYDNFEGGKEFTQTSPNDTDRKVIRSGYFVIEVENFDSSYAAVFAVAQGTGGWIESSNVYKDKDGRRTGYITLRVPSDNFDAVFNEIKQYGDVKSEQTSNMDVTEEFIDLSARLDVLYAQEIRYIELLGKAETVEDILSIEVQLERIRSNIESLEGRITYLSSQIDMALINVTLQEPEKGEEFPIVSAFKRAASAFVDAIVWIIIFIGYAIPITIVGALGYFGVKRIRRKK